MWIFRPNIKLIYNQQQKRIECIIINTNTPKIYMYANQVRLLTLMIQAWKLVNGRLKANDKSMFSNLYKPYIYIYILEIWSAL